MTALRAVLALALGVVLVVLLVSGGKSDEEKVRDTLEDYATATRERDYQRLCDDLYARELVSTVRRAGLPCEVALRTGLTGLRRPTLVVRSVEISDDQALAAVRTDAANQEPAEVSIRLVEQDDRWRVASLAAAQPQPPEPTQP